MTLDIRTLLVAVSLATACCAMARVLLWRLHPAMPGLGLWASASALGAVALILVTARGAVPDMISLSLPQVLMAVGYLLVWQGFRDFTGRPRVLPWVIGALAFGVLVPVGISQLEHSLEMRSVTNAGLIALISATIGRELLTGAAPTQMAMRATGWIYAANAAFFAVRSIGAALGAESIIGNLSYGPLPALALLWWLCMTVAVTLGMVLMAGERLQQDLDRQARRDPLTGALNRRAFGDLADKEVARARRSGQPLSVLMMDLDHFKQINDSLGHAGGDSILCLFVQVVDRVLRTEDVFCRFGGEEFLALLPASAAGHALAVAERLRLAYADKAASLTTPARQVPFAFTVSIGVSEMPSGGDLESAIQRADTALYRAKKAGRNRCEVAMGIGEVAAKGPALAAPVRGREAS